MFKEILVIIYSNISGAGLGNISVVVRYETCQFKLVILSHDKIINLNNGCMLVLKAEVHLLAQQIIAVEVWGER